MTTRTSNQPWHCPECGSSDLSVYYSERRTCSVTTSLDSDDPWPSLEADEHVELDPFSFEFICIMCGMDDIEPTREVVTTDEASVAENSQTRSLMVARALVRVATIARGALVSRITRREE